MDKKLFFFTQNNSERMVLMYSSKDSSLFCNKWQMREKFDVCLSKVCVIYEHMEMVSKAHSDRFLQHPPNQPTIMVAVN